MSECSLALSFTVDAACFSFSLAGSSEEISMPAPKAMRPAASGLPCVFCRATVGADVAASPTVDVTEDALSVAEPIAPPSVDALPITFSFTEPTAPLARSTRRSTTRAGLTFSVRASTSRLRSALVASMSRRMTSGSSLRVDWSVVSFR